jgi:TolB-like protein
MASPSSPDFWKRLDELFNRAMDMEPASRRQFVAESCGDDARLRAELESLLRSAEEPDVLQGLVHSAASDYLTKKRTLEPGAMIAGYEIVSLLGEGGMGQVYLAQDSRLRRKVAIKILIPAVVHDRDSLRRFEQEALAASALNHPNILTIYEVGESNGTRFIVSEFVDGSTLREILSAGSLKITEAVDIAIQTAAGLNAAHPAGIIHRDIKPENIIVRKDGIVKIVDFGIAKLGPDATGKALKTFSATRPGIVLGTARYMSPEQAQGLEVDGRTDIYSLGAVLAEMISGQPIPLDLTAILKKATHKDRDSRFRTAQELLDALQSFKEEHGYRIKSSGRLRARPPAAARRMWILAAVLLVVLLAAGYFASKRFSGRAATIPLHRLAILPFRNLKPDAATDFLGYSLADAVITKMGYISSVMVRPSSSIDQYRNQNVDPRRVGADLNVDTVLTGSFIKEGDDLRINTQLVDVGQNRMIWQDTIDTRYAGLLTVEDRVAQQIINGLELSLSSTEAGNLKLDSPDNRAAYEDYLRGVDLYALADFSSAVEMLERSTSEAPDYAPAWAHLGRAYTTAASLEFGGREMYDKAQAAYKKALALNPALISARIYMSNLLTDTGHAEEAVPLMRGALENNRNSAEAHWELGYAYRFGGLLRESIAECERAREIAPAVKATSSAMNSYLYMGKYDKFLASLPPNGTAYITFYRGFAEYYRHDFQKATAEFDRAYKLDPALLQAQVGKAIADGVRGQKVDGLSKLRDTESRIAERGVSDAEGIYKVVQAYAVLGDAESGLRMFAKVIEDGFFCYPYFLHDPLIDNLRNQPGFADLLNKARVRHEAFKAKFGS